MADSVSVKTANVHSHVCACLVPVCLHVWQNTALSEPESTTCSIVCFSKIRRQSLKPWYYYPFTSCRTDHNYEELCGKTASQVQFCSVVVSKKGCKDITTGSNILKKNPILTLALMQLLKKELYAVCVLFHVKEPLCNVCNAIKKKTNLSLISMYFV